jgi:DNA primase
MTVLDDITNVCQDLLKNFIGAEEARKYIDKRLSKEAQEKFNFGYFPNHNYLNLITSAVGESNLSNIDLLYQKIVTKSFETTIEKYSPLENHNLIMPYRDLYGNIVALVGRTLLSDEEYKLRNIPKYKNTEFKKSKHLFGLFESKMGIIKSNSVFVVEGQLDCISAYDKGIHNIVALGSANMTLEQMALLLRYTDNINLMLDNDEAGFRGRERIIEKYSKFANIKNVYLPEGYKDIDEFLQENSPEDMNYFKN